MTPEKNMQKHTAILLIVLFLSLGCSPFFPGGQTQVPPEQVPTIIPTGAATLPPLPDFMKYIILAGEGAGGGGDSFCYPFDVPSPPSVVGGTLYSHTVQDLREWESTQHEGITYTLSEYGRHAQLCIGGIPENQLITLKLVSPDGKITLTARIEVVPSSQSEHWPDIIWEDHPESWTAAYKDNADSPVEVKLPLWWAGALPSGIWRAEVNWPGHNFFGDFNADIRQSPEISLTDPRSRSEIFPRVRAASCRLGYAQTSPYTVLAENYPPNFPLYILVYHAYFNNGGAGPTDLELEYQTFAYTDALGSAKVDLSHMFASGEVYFILGVPPGVSNLMFDDTGWGNSLSLATIQNAIDCFQMP